MLVGFTLITVSKKLFLCSCCDKGCRHYCLVAVIIVFLLIFPIVFFADNNCHNNVPTFFIFTVVFAILVLRGEHTLVISLLRVLLCVKLYLITCRFPSAMAPFTARTSQLTSVLLTFISMDVIYNDILCFRLGRCGRRRLLLRRRGLQLHSLSGTGSAFLAAITRRVGGPLDSVSLRTQSASRLLRRRPLSFSLVRRGLHAVRRSMVQVSQVILSLVSAISVRRKQLTLSLIPSSLSNLLCSMGGSCYDRPDPGGGRLILIARSKLPGVSTSPRQLVRIIAGLVSGTRHRARGKAVAVSLANRSN